MSGFMLENEALVRLGGFTGVLVLMLAWEAAAPRRPAAAGPHARRLTNLALVAVDTALLRLLLPAAAVMAAAVAQQRGFGVFNLVQVPAWLAVPASIALLDGSIWLQHRAMHAYAPLWRLHRVHHSDLAFDVTTGVRFHPLEILLSMAYKVMVVVVLGAPPVAVVVFEVLLGGSALFTHGNVRLPLVADRWLRWLIVTPDMHRVHHSVRREETDCNFGFLLAVWDRLFGTYRAQPADGHAGMDIGLMEFRAAHEQRLDRLLLQPLWGARPEPGGSGADVVAAPRGSAAGTTTPRAGATSAGSAGNVAGVCVQKPPTESVARHNRPERRPV